MFSEKIPITSAVRFLLVYMSTEGLMFIIHHTNFTQQTITCSKSKIKTVEKKVWYIFKPNNKVFVVNFEHFPHFFNIYTVDFEQVKVC